MNPESCTLYENCECPLCPLEADSNQVWYSEDEIRKNPDFHIVGNSMKKLKKKGTPGYFTLQILDRDFVVRKGIEGIAADLVDSVKDPWKEYQEREDVAEKHPEISKARSDNLKLRGKSLADSRKLIQKVLSDNSFSEIVNPKGIILVLTLNLLRNQ